MPVVTPPATHSATAGAPSSVVEVIAAVPSTRSAGAHQRTPGLLMSAQRASALSAERKRVAMRAAVETVNASEGTGAPFQVTKLAADPRKMRYTQARAREKPMERMPKNSRGETPSGNSSRAPSDGAPSVGAPSDGTPSAGAHSTGRLSDALPSDARPSVVSIAPIAPHPLPRPAPSLPTSLLTHIKAHRPVWGLDNRICGAG